MKASYRHLLTFVGVAAGLATSAAPALAQRAPATGPRLMVPVFAAQYVAGQTLYDAGNGGPAAPGWAKPVHETGAATIAGIFGVNTLTGLWNLWDSRHTEDHRWLRLSLSVIMLGADAAFAYTGIKLADDAEESQAKRRQHRDAALWSMGVSVGSGVVMKIFNNR